MSEKTNRKWSNSTKAIHAGEHVDPTTKASSPNLVMSSTFAPSEFAGFSALNREGYSGFSYSRVANPTVNNLQEKLAILEGAEAAQVFGSGMAAAHALLMSRLTAGDHIIFSEVNYVGIAELIRNSLPRWGIQVSPVDTSDIGEISSAIRPNTKMIWLETPANPILRLADIKEIAQMAKDRMIKDVVVDSTFATPIATKPLELGANFVMHSLTKYICGHGDAMGGAILGSKENIDDLNLEAAVHYGGILSPFNAWLISRGAATLPIRMKAHEDNAKVVVDFLKDHSKVDTVFYPGLSTHPQHQLAKKQMMNYSGMIAFTTKMPGEAIAKNMIENLGFIHFAVSLGHHRTLIYWIPTDPILKSSFKLNKRAEKKYKSIAKDGVFRLSVGLENPKDICEDLDRVL